MSKYKIHIDKPLPTSEQIARHKNFGKVYLDYEQATRFTFWRDLRTNPRYFATLVMVLAIGYLIFEISKKERMAELALVSAPLQVDIAYQYQTIPVEKDVTLEFGQDARVSLPAFAFVDSNGNDINGTIQLAYREFRDARDLFIAGIPMDADSAASGKLLDSGGMVELLAFQNGRRVFVKPGARVNITFLSGSVDENYQVYRLDQALRAWQLNGRDTVDILLKDSDILKHLPPKPKPRVLQIRTQKPPPADDSLLIPKSIKPSFDPVYESQLEKWNQQYQQVRDSLEKYASIRRFSVDQLGYFCIGKKLDVPNIECSFRIKDLKKSSIGKIWVVQNDLNTLSSYPFSKDGVFPISVFKEKEVTVWIPLENDKLGIVSSISCSDEPGNEYEMKVIEGPFRKVGDLKVHLLDRKVQ